MRIAPPMKGWSLVRVSALALVLLGALVAFFLWNGPRPLVLNVHGASAAMGRDFADAAPRRLKLLKKHYLQGIICRGDPEIYREYRRRAETWTPHIDPAHQEELLAFARAADLRVEGAVLANAFIDMGLYTGACRSLVVDGAEGFYHAHNLDWDGLAGLANWVICVVRRTPEDGRFRTVTLTVVGLLGALDVINEHGIALSINQSPGRTEGPVEPTFLRIRRIAEQCRSFEEARDALLAGPSMIPFHITLSSSSERRAAVFESGGTFVERPMDDGVAGADNAAWGAVPGRCPVEQAARGADIATVEDVKAVLRSPQILLDCNIYSVIVDVAGNRLHLASGRTPAAQFRYRQFPLFVEEE